MNRILLVAVAACAAANSAVPDAAQAIRPVLNQYCVGCHNDKARTGGLSLQSLVADDDAVIEKVDARVRAGTMPPPGLPKPSKAQRDAMLVWTKGQLAAFEKRRKPVAGRVTARRLNRAEYNNTIRDLLGVDFHPADDFPSDDSGYGFDNNGDVLTVSPVLMEKYLTAARKVSERAIQLPGKVTPSTITYRADNSRFNNFIDARHRAVAEGEFEIALYVAVNGKGQTPQMPLALSIDGRIAENFIVDARPNRNRVFTATVRMTAGEHDLRAILVEEAKAPDQDNTKRTRASLDGMEVKGPFNAAPPPSPESHRRIFICGEKTVACAQKILSALQRRAFRRPVTLRETVPYIKLFEKARAEGDSFEAAMQYALQGILVSPEFLFRIERDGITRKGADRALGNFELASRLSYFLWSSMPDEELMRVSQTGKLTLRPTLETQVRRMMKDAKSAAFVENFAGQWLQLRNLERQKPDPARFPQFDEPLRAAMQRETFLFIDSVLREDRSILDLIDGKYTFVNERLAKHYGIPGVTGSEFRKVALAGDQRSGVLTQASVLTVTSYEGRTSPVSRGKWLLQNLLGAAPPPPPANVPALEEKASAQTLTVRQQMEQHRASPACAGCHVQMDPLGFSLENFDAVGAWRTTDGKTAIDASGTLPDGRSFNGPAQLKSILLGEKDTFARVFTDKVLTYALGRGVERVDAPVVKQIAGRVAANDYRFSSLIIEIANSMPFRMKRVETN